MSKFRLYGNQKMKFHFRKSADAIDVVHIDKKLSKMLAYDKNRNQFDSKFFMGHKNDEKVKSLCMKIPKVR